MKPEQNQNDSPKKYTAEENIKGLYFNSRKMLEVLEALLQEVKSQREANNFSSDDSLPF